MILKASPKFGKTSPAPFEEPQWSGTDSHLVRGAVLLSTASRWLFVVLADVHHLALGALSDEVSTHARDILEPMTWSKKKSPKTD